MNKDYEECDHINTHKNIWDTDEVEEICDDCGAKRDGYVAWSDWEEPEK